MRARTLVLLAGLMLLAALPASARGLGCASDRGGGPLFLTDAEGGAFLDWQGFRVAVTGGTTAGADPFEARLDGGRSVLVTHDPETLRFTAELRGPQGLLISDVGTCRREP